MQKTHISYAFFCTGAVFLQWGQYLPPPASTRVKDEVSSMQGCAAFDPELPMVVRTGRDSKRSRWKNENNQDGKHRFVKSPKELFDKRA